MVFDKQRVETYQRAIRATVREGDTCRAVTRRTPTSENGKEIAVQPALAFLFDFLHVPERLPTSVTLNSHLAGMRADVPLRMRGAFPLLEALVTDARDTVLEAV